MTTVVLLVVCVNMSRRAREHKVGIQDPNLFQNIYATSLEYSSTVKNVSEPALSDNAFYLSRAIKLPSC